MQAGLEPQKANTLIAAPDSTVTSTPKWGFARQRGHSDDIEEGASGAKKSGIAFAAVAGASVILGGILALTTAAGA
jgi:hypothetical protein